MKTHKYTEQELKMTAVIYATREEIVDHIHSSGKLPSRTPLGGFSTAMKFLLRSRRIEGSLSEKEQLVYDAILREKRLPAGGVILFQDSQLMYSESQTKKSSYPCLLETWIGSDSSNVNMK